MKQEPRSSPRPAAERVYGLAAARAAFAMRPEAVLSIAHTAELRRPLADMLRSAAQRRIAYREVDEAELARMAQSVHHEGVCLLVRPAAPLRSAQLLEAAAASSSKGLLLALDGVQNPHNVGAILRSAAYFGARGLICSESADKDEAGKPSLSAAARRVAEGGAEHVPVLRTKTLLPLLKEARRAGFTVVGSSIRATTELADYAWPERALLILGHERHGLTREVESQCQDLLRIAGSDVVDSLNVSVAAGIFLASYALRSSAPVARARKRGGSHG